MAEDMTQKAVDTLIDTLDNREFKIIIIDNGSSNNSGEYLKRVYADRLIVDVLLNEENSGYARGNNAAYKYARVFCYNKVVTPSDSLMI